MSSKQMLITEDGPRNTGLENTDLVGNDGPSHFPFKSDKYLKDIKIERLSCSADKMDMTFDMVNADAPVANTIRRVLLAEVPSIAIDRVYLYQNTSLIPDETLCHRLGLVPVSVSRELIEWATPPIFKTPSDIQTEPIPADHDAVVFSLHVKCTKNASARKEASEPNELFHNSNVYSGDMKWVPVGGQSEAFARSVPAVVHPDILIAKLRPGQEIEARCHCYKGIGQDHAKFSPVATAAFRPLPVIELTRPVLGEAAVRLQESFTKGVIQTRQNKKGEQEAFVADARRDMVSRNIYRHEDLVDAVKTG